MLGFPLEQRVHPITINHIQEHAMETTSLQELAERLFDYLTGYGRGQPEKLQQLMAFDDWQRLARSELERRRMALVGMLDSELLEAIASGDIYVDRIARDVLKRSTGQKS